LGIGDWGLGPIPNPQSPIPNPQSPIPVYIYLIKYKHLKYPNLQIRKKLYNFYSQHKYNIYIKNIDQNIIDY
jgi:hypothetical protein